MTGKRAAVENKEQSLLIICAISGGIAAYKTADLVSRLTHKGYRVRVLMSQAATRFVSPLTFQALTRAPVATDLFCRPDASNREEIFPHIYPAVDADAFILAPATADSIARLALGRASDLISASALALRPDSIRIFCPAMNSAMWTNPAVQHNVLVLEERGWIRIGPESGPLACGDEGAGRMVEPERIVTEVEGLLESRGILAGHSVLICSGPTREPLDQVRYITNASSGRMGKELALAAAQAGARVHFVTGPVCPSNLPQHPAVQVYPVSTAAEMLQQAGQFAPECDVFLFPAAVCDFRPVRQARGKIPRKQPLSVQLEPTEDIAANIASKRNPGSVAVGFALDVKMNRGAAEEKLRAKNLDAVVLNDLKAMNAQSSRYGFIYRQHKTIRFEDWGELDKRTCARRIIHWIAATIRPD